MITSIFRNTKKTGDGANPDRLASVPAGAFERYLNGIIHEWTKTITVLGFTLIPFFGVLDYYTMPIGLVERFWVNRAVTTLLVLAQFFIIRAGRPSKQSYVHGYVFALIAGGMIVGMTNDLGGFDSAYYAGLMLVIMAVNQLLPWRAVHSAVNGLLVMGMYLLVNLAWGGPFHTTTLVNNLYFLGSTVIISVAITATRHRLVEKEFRLRAELLDMNERLDTSRRDLQLARDALWGEMEMAKRIQTALLPADRDLGRFETCAVMQPADEVGGDYYDILETRGGERWVAIGDVSGHGVESGLVMMMTQTSVSSIINNRAGLAPSAVFAAVNSVIKENIRRLGAGRYMTLNLIRLEDDRLVAAGKHQDIQVLRARTGRVEMYPTTGSWIGVVDDVSPFTEDMELPLEAGDTVLLYTDGITEARNAGGELYGEERLARSLEQVAGLPLAHAMREILDGVGTFQSGQDDDITLILLRRNC